jgi:NAD(P)-dependent dehydrogenase (short-subunit alcohol dehydrogenase family)
MKYAFLTGATTGIGLATAKLLGKKGYTVLLNGIDKAQGDAAAAELTALGIANKVYLFDVCDEHAIISGIKQMSVETPHLDLLVNTAGGLGGRQRIGDMETTFFRNVMALNFDSTLFVTREALPLLKKGTDASVINFTSIAAWSAGGPGAGIYAASKAAVLTLTRAMAKDFAEFGIRANAVSPGTIDTAFHQATKDNNPEMWNTWRNNILMKRFGTADEVASVVAFLASNEAAYITGEVIQINGGQDFL